MKKSSFAAMILGTVSAVLFALGMCMALLPEWDAFVPGIVLGCTGIIFAIIAVIVWRKMENKAPLKLNGKTVLTAVIGIVGALVLGLGMCLCMVWGKMVIGIIVGLAGIIILLCLIPLIKGLK
ncbi:MAG: hypothetical protein ACI4KI_03770 [Candidatus Fimenecus sp.]